VQGREADKAEALASYARQSQDDTLRKMCDLFINSD
jgi:hypothetical protein